VALVVVELVQATAPLADQRLLELLVPKTPKPH
jgi:hypothetical protein